MEQFNIEYNDNIFSIFGIKYYSEDAKGGNPYNTCFTVKVISDNFSGTSEFEYDYKEFIKFIKEINCLYDFKLNKVVLHEICYGSKIEFVLDEKTGHIGISGRIFGDAMLHQLSFAFNVDQTAIESFVKSLYRKFII